MSLPVSNTSQNHTNSDAVDCFSLSIDSAMEGGISTYSNSTNLSNVSLLSPLRKMDFALCKHRISYVQFHYYIYSIYTLIFVSLRYWPSFLFKFSYLCNIGYRNLILSAIFVTWSERKQTSENCVVTLNFKLNLWKFSNLLNCATANSSEQ